MSFELLRKGLTQMPPTGESGFEGVVAALLSALTGDRYYVARSGDQPADAASLKGTIAIQAKRYVKTRIDETDFEGDFHKACRLLPQLDCYLLVTTRATLQLQTLADELQERTGVDIVLLLLDSSDSGLGALCVTFWNFIKHFPKLCDLGSDFDLWAEALAKLDTTARTISDLRDSFTNSVPVAGAVSRRLSRYLAGRFSIETSEARPYRFQIDLPHAVARQASQNSLHSWWLQGKSKAVIIIGEEGMGKSWVASYFAYDLIKSTETIVLWLDSADWSGLTNIGSVVDAALVQAGYSDKTLRDRLVGKAMTRWSAKLIVFLDGLNERKAYETGHRLMAELLAAESSPCRLVFTTRPTNWKSDERALWAAATQIPVGPFANDELAEALKRLPQPMAISDLPLGLVTIASTPRYFLRTIQLRSHFGTLANVTKEMVLWTDLLAKIEAGDRQVTEDIGWTSQMDLRRALVKLAANARAIQSGSQAHNDNYALLQASFGSAFERIRTDLAEQRVLLNPSGDNPTPSAAHLTLGFALHLGASARDSATENVAELADELRKELEPISSQDQQTEALFIALQLSALGNSQGLTLSAHARSALLLAWVSSQNSHVEPQRLQFWADYDAPAYLDFVEEAFVEPVSNGWEETLITPLKKTWAFASQDSNALDARLRRWLKLIWKSHNSPPGPSLVLEGHILPVARSQPQLVLSLIALSILSKRPAESFLPDLAVSAATRRLSTQRYHWPKHPGGPPESTEDHPCKEIDYNLGALLRWKYTEAVKTQIQALLNESLPDSVIAKGLTKLESYFDEFGWKRLSVPEDDLRAGKPMFEGTPDQKNNRFASGPELAARDDIPDIAEADQVVIGKSIELTFSSKALYSGRSRTGEDLQMEYNLPWFAKYYPEKLAELASKYRLAALEFEEAGQAFNFITPFPFSDQIVNSHELLSSAKKYVEHELSHPDQRFCWPLQQLHAMAFTCLNAEDLKEWFLFSSKHKRVRKEIHFYPTPILCPLLVPPDIALFAREQAQRCCDDPQVAGHINEAEFDFWANIGGRAGGPDSDFHNWCENQIRNRLPTQDRLYFWQLLWLKSADDSTLQNHISDGTIFDLIGSSIHTWRLLAKTRFLDWQKLRTDLKELITKLPIAEVGVILKLANRQSDFDRWGHLTFQRAIDQVGHIPFDREFWGSTIYSTDSTGRIVGSGCKQGVGIQRSIAEGLRPTQQNFGALLTGESNAEWEQKANEAIRVWRRDRDRIAETLPTGFDQFDAFAELGA